MKTARACSEWVTSCVLGSDLVPRISVDSVEGVRNETLEIIARIKVNKATVLKSAIIGKSGQERLGLMNDLMDDLASPAPDTDFNRQVIHFMARQEEIKHERERDGFRPDVSLYPPGKIIHYVDTEEKSTCFGSVGANVCGARRREYTPTWSKNDALGEIMISPSMLLDHFPDRVCRSIEATAEAWGIEVAPGSQRSKGEKGRSLAEMGGNGKVNGEENLMNLVDNVV